MSMESDTEITEPAPSLRATQVQPFAFLHNPQPGGRVSFADYVAGREGDERERDYDDEDIDPTHPSFTGDVPELS